ncbi:MAG: hypothetical protein ACXAC2_00135 [Candidatus Kariarchaeaceae archaeon]|jgi:hypothetical protein
MATLAELYTEIDTNPLTINRVTDQDQPTYTVERISYIIDTVENEARETSVVIHIKFRNNVGGTEVAYYRPKLQYLKSTTFKDLLTTEIATFQGSNPNLEEWEFVGTPSEAQRFGFIKVWWNNAGQTEIRYYFLWEDGGSVIQFRQITNFGS